ncbi:HAD family hydrolase [Teredinibacter purpureus]|uniref:HAD family hydrolase n=1 Tax=Teredinibacter purpureus TaxID=2731756 RepID=UPI0005F808ED|nr:HAD-IA family hydrolase [Teredinibacter purpureus]
MNPKLTAVFFDLDGTLLDTAPDLAAALNRLLRSKSMPELPLTAVRNVVSDGANAMLQMAFNCKPNDNGFAELRSALLNFYLLDLATHTTTFDGIDTLLENLASKGIHWGVVTNKPWTYTEPLMNAFKFSSEPCSIICPEHVEERKPAPDALLLACKQSACLPQNALYIGDHKRDILCGINAGMPTIAVGYGYIDANDSHENWNATHCVNNASEIWPIIETYL